MTLKMNKPLIQASTKGSSSYLSDVVVIDEIQDLNFSVLKLACFCIAVQ